MSAAKVDHATACKSRTPKLKVRQALRREVGFICPVDDCAAPYLEWHHFDPPWHEIHAHNKAGMIALCSEHHKKADAGAFTHDQLRAMKLRGQENRIVSGRFDWLRRQLVTVIGGVVAVNCPIALRYYEQPAIWFGRDADLNLLVNVDWLPSPGKTRLRMIGNDWELAPGALDVECPPNGRILKVTFPDGAWVRLEFVELNSFQEANARFGPTDPEAEAVPRDPWPVTFPVTAVSITARDDSIMLDIAQDCVSFQTNKFYGSLVGGRKVALQLGHTKDLKGVGMFIM